MKIKVFIKQRNKDVENIIFRLVDGRKIDLHHKSEILVSVSEFDNKAGKMILSKSRIKDANLIRLTDLQKKIDKRYNLIADWYIEQKSDTLTSAMLEQAIDRNLHPEKYIIEEETEPDTLLAYVSYFLRNADNRKVRGTNRKVTLGTKKAYYNLQKHLIEFAKYQRKKDYRFNEVDDTFYSDFVDYLTNKEYVQKSKRNEQINKVSKYTLNTIGKQVKTLKLILASSDKININTSKFSVFKEEVNNVYLNEDELEAIRLLDLTNNQSLDRVRDWFLLSSWTGTRYSDIDKINKQNIKEGLLKIRQQKTSMEVYIPIHPVVEGIFKKYEYDIPKVISNQKFNDYIKELCQLAGINTLESITRTIGGKEVTETMPKYEFVSVHTCRRSFCTNMYKKGFDTLMIRSISGHKTEKSFLSYIKITAKEHAERMMHQWKLMYK